MTPEEKEALKNHLRDHYSEWMDRNSWCGDTETGFHTEYELNYDKLVEEIDAFSKTFKEKK